MNESWYLLRYKCTCGYEWNTEWDHACDDRCNACGTIMPPKYAMRMED